MALRLWLRNRAASHPWPRSRSSLRSLAFTGSG